MPKPTRNEVYRTLIASHDGRRGPWTSSKADDLIALIDAAWTENDAERERGRKAMEILERWGHPAHSADCDRCYWGGDALDCTCGLSRALAEIAAVVPLTAGAESGAKAHADPKRDPDSALWEYADKDSVERFNEQQRWRRGGYVEALEENRHYNTSRTERVALAARRYPLKKRAPATCDDPHDVGQWTVEVEEGRGYPYAVWRSRAGTELSRAWPPEMLVTAERVRALSALLDNPWKYEDDTSVEDAPCP
jgi:hypothetical protein